MAEEEGVPESVDAEEARELIGKGRVRVVDIRGEDDFARERMTNAVRAEPDEVKDALEEGDDGREAVLVVCEDGERSAEVAESLRSDGIEATSIDGGFGAWTSEGLPTAPGRDEEYEGPEIKLPGAVASDTDPDDEDEDGEEADEDDPGEDDRAEERT
jgi:rhodanese-related sulfurtransferase